MMRKIQKVQHQQHQTWLKPTNTSHIEDDRQQDELLQQQPLRPLLKPMTQTLPFSLRMPPISSPPWQPPNPPTLCAATSRLSSHSPNRVLQSSLS